jgi:hypothetical protein
VSRPRTWACVLPDLSPVQCSCTHEHFGTPRLVAVPSLRLLVPCPAPAWHLLTMSGCVKYQVPYCSRECIGVSGM